MPIHTLLAWFALIFNFKPQFLSTLFFPIYTILFFFYLNLYFPIFYPSSPWSNFFFFLLLFTWPSLFLYWDWASSSLSPAGASPLHFLGRFDAPCHTGPLPLKEKFSGLGPLKVRLNLATIHTRCNIFSIFIKPLYKFIRNTKSHDEIVVLGLV